MGWEVGFEFSEVGKDDFPARLQSSPLWRVSAPSAQGAKGSESLTRGKSLGSMLKSPERATQTASGSARASRRSLLNARSIVATLDSIRNIESLWGGNFQRFKNPDNSIAETQGN